MTLANVKKRLIALLLLAGCTAFSFSAEFRLRHDLTGKELGPYATADGKVIKIANAVFTVLNENEKNQSFRLKHHDTGKILGPFKFEAGSKVLLGSTAFTMVDESHSTATQSEERNSSRYPGLPALDRSHLLVIKPEIRKQILEATMATVEGDLWKEHLAAIEQRILDITAVSTFFQREHSYGQVVEQPVLFTMLMQL